MEASGRVGRLAHHRAAGVNSTPTCDRRYYPNIADGADLRCLNVRQSWASLLVEGTKTVENRPPGANRPHFDVGRAS